MDMRVGSLPLDNDSHAAYPVDSPSLGPINVRQRRCPLCNTQNEGEASGRYDHDIWRVLDCKGCGFVYLDKAPVYDELSANLAWEKTKVLEAARRLAMRKGAYTLSKKARWRLHVFPRRQFPKLVARFAQPGPVIDVGCGKGLQMAALAEGFVPYGVEVSAVQAAEADALFASKGGRCVHAPALSGLSSLPGDNFSAATLRSYLEHEEHPLPVLREVHRILRPGGVAIIKVPNYGSVNRRLAGRKWVGFRYPDHLNYFTPRSLQEMAVRAGFSRPRYGLADCFPTSDNMYAVLRK